MVIAHGQAVTWMNRVLAESQPNGTPPAWANETVALEFPLGEMDGDPLKTLALCGGRTPQVKRLDGTEVFAAQGLESKAVVQKPLCEALHVLADMLSNNRGRIVWKRPK